MRVDEFCLLFDDDAVFVQAISDLIRNHLREKGFRFEMGMSINDVPSIIERNKNNELLIAILDLWFMDKVNHSVNESEGYDILHLIRQKWPRCYIIFLSSHIDEEVYNKLKHYYNIAIFEKAMSTSTLLDNIDALLKEIKK